MPSPAGMHIDKIINMTTKKCVSNKIFKSGREIYANSQVIKRAAKIRNLVSKDSNLFKNKKINKFSLKYQRLMMESYVQKVPIHSVDVKHKVPTK